MQIRVRSGWQVAIISFILLACAGLLARRGGVPGWEHYRAAKAPGSEEALLTAQFLAEHSEPHRYEALFSYFARGFIRHADPSFARVRYGGAGSVYGFDVSGLEGFSRTAPLLAAWVYGGRPRTLKPPPQVHSDSPSADFVEALRAGILAGVDPASKDYWGDIHDYDQRVVEAADIARVLWLTRTDIWEHLDSGQRALVSNWLVSATHARTPQNNWELFLVLIDLLVARLDPQAEARHSLIAHAHRTFNHYRRLYAESGWFHDNPHGTDFYNTWGVTYDLFWISQLDPQFETSFITQAILDSAQLTAHLIGPVGIPIIGRSICYRTAVPVPLLAASLLQPGVDAAGERALRALDVVWSYFLSHDSLRDGALTQGYFVADLRFLDSYSGPGSCHWGLRSLVLAFMQPQNGRFWSGRPRPLPVEEADFSLDLPKLGWTIVGRRSSAEIAIEVAANAPGIIRADPYTPLDRVLEIIRHRPKRPANNAVKYEARRYSSATPFPAEP